MISCTWNARFETLLSMRDAHESARQRAYDALTREYQQAFVDAWRAAVGATERRKVPYDDTRTDSQLWLKHSALRKIPADAQQRIIDEYRDSRARGLAARFDWTLARIERALMFLAQRCTIQQTETATLYRTTSTDEFRSQTDSYGYARRTAEMTAAEIEGCRAEVWPALHYWSHSRDANGRVQPLRDSYSGSRYGIDEFRVMAYTDQTGVEIIKRRPGVTLREWVRRCWKKGINPRVLNPYLPAGYEEKHGLDYWGNDLRATSDAGKAAVNA
jgi:hypothetical protein